MSSAVVVIGATPALATTVTVTSTADLPDADLSDGVCAAAGGACTLRAAVQQTDALPGMDTVTVPPGTYLLDSALRVEDSLFLNAPGGAATTVLDGQHHDSVLEVRTAELLVCDSARNSVVSVDRNGQRNGTLVSPGAGGLSIPGAVTPGNDGDVYVTGFSTGVVRYDGRTGAPKSVFVANGSGGLGGATDAEFHGDYLYVTDYVASRVLRYDRFTGAFVDVVVPARSGGLANPNSLLFRGNELLVTSAGSDAVLRYDAGTGAYLGALVAPFSGGLDTPRGMVVRGGSLYVSSWANDRVLKYDATTGAYQSTFVTAGSGGLDRPTDLVFSEDGDLLVLSFGTRQVLRYSGTTGAYRGVHLAGTAGSPLLDTPACLAPRVGTGHGPIVSVTGLTLRNGRSDVGVPGAGLYVNAGASVTLSDSVVRDNSSSVFGGGISNWGVLDVRRSEVRDNSLPEGGGGQTSQGGGIFNNGSLTLTDTTLAGNVATRGGGLSNLKHADLVGVTVSGNRVWGGGGGIRNVSDDAVLDISFSTITGNEANRPGGSGEPDRFGGGIMNLGPVAQVNVANSVIAGNTDNRDRFQSGYGPDCYSPTTFRMTSHRDNLLGVLSDSCVIRDTIFGDHSTIQSGTGEAPLDPRLGPLGANGGLPRTHALLSGSPAIDADVSGTSATFFDCGTHDARQQPRPVDGDLDGTPRCDLGAYEYQPPSDGDGVSPATEDGAPHGGDGNSDGIPDRLQPGVASLPAANGAGYVTFVASPGSVLQDVHTTAPAPGAPAGVRLPVGAFSFSVTASPTATVQLLLPPGTAPDAYWKHGPRPGAPTPAWYDFSFAGGTGATVSGDTVTLHLVDGVRGDSDLTANGIVTDPGGPVTLLRCDGQVATIVGTEGNDRITGTAGDDVIVALGGKDKVQGGDGNDVVCGGAGDDTIHGGAGDDHLFGGDGHDSLHGGPGADLLDGLDDDSVKG
ncbi:choice-of-anchor U domain-containing protein [Motilibacter peucedani]|uniref:choice-of-anchor U domain-containing protein n=1 Tax=Motilibacter peucedani TaxID=598650 RepID=UPI001603E2BE|nr:choice-of-anchor U domain-containing protein [Motilibacter peucedani]